jgi:hypothetical protein
MRVSYDRATNTARILLTEYTNEDVARWKMLAEHDIEGEFTYACGGHRNVDDPRPY